MMKKFEPEQITKIRSSNLSDARLAAEFDVNQITISRIRKGLTYKDGKSESPSDLDRLVIAIGDLFGENQKALAEGLVKLNERLDSIEAKLVKPVESEQPAKPNHPTPMTVMEIKAAKARQTNGPQQT